MFYSGDGEKPEEDFRLGALFSLYGIQQLGKRKWTSAHENQVPVFPAMGASFPDTESTGSPPRLQASLRDFVSKTPGSRSRCPERQAEAAFCPRSHRCWRRARLETPAPGDAVPSRRYHLQTGHSKKQSRQTDRQGKRHPERMKVRRAGIRGRSQGAINTRLLNVRGPGEQLRCPLLRNCRAPGTAENPGSL